MPASEKRLQAVHAQKKNVSADHSTSSTLCLVRFARSLTNVLLLLALGFLIGGFAAINKFGECL